MISLLLTRASARMVSYLVIFSYFFFYLVLIISHGVLSLS
jgi:hypothetical protein